MTEKLHLYYLNNDEAKLIEHYRTLEKSGDAVDDTLEAPRYLQTELDLDDHGTDKDNQQAAEEAADDAAKHLDDDTKKSPLPSKDELKKKLDELKQSKYFKADETNPLNPYRLSTSLGKTAGKLVDSFKQGYRNQK